MVNLWLQTVIGIPLHVIFIGKMMGLGLPDTVGNHNYVIFILKMINLWLPSGIGIPWHTILIKKKIGLGLPHHKLYPHPSI